MRSMGESATAATGSTVVVHVPDEQALAALARRLASALPAKAVVALDGELGAGKTTFVKAVAAAVGIDPGTIVSPTFGLIHVHVVSDRPAGPSRLVHADFYRLADAAELSETGWDDAITGACWAFVEWPGRIGRHLPPDRIDVAIRIDAPTARTFTFTPRGGLTLADTLAVA